MTMNTEDRVSTNCYWALQEHVPGRVRHWRPTTLELEMLEALRSIERIAMSAGGHEVLIQRILQTARAAIAKAVA